jgi:hypothetical protein
VKKLDILARATKIIMCVVQCSARTVDTFPHKVKSMQSSAMQCQWEETGKRGIPSSKLQLINWKADPANHPHPNTDNLGIGEKSPDQVI